VQEQGSFSFHSPKQVFIKPTGGVDTKEKRRKAETVFLSAYRKKKQKAQGSTALPTNSDPIR
jgi:hypothetical protein